LQLGSHVDIRLLKGLNIKFNQITKLQIEFIHFQFNFVQLFSNDLKNNLVYLSLINNCGFYYSNSEESYVSSVLETINELTSLKYLKLSRFSPNKSFVLKLSHLKKISLEKCRNISFDQDIFLELNTFEIKDCYIEGPKSLIKCPKLKNFLLKIVIVQQ
jgi:hypothetical protein